jgi:hypothetical protein
MYNGLHDNTHHAYIYLNLVFDISNDLNVWPKYIIQNPILVTFGHCHMMN